MSTDRPQYGEYATPEEQRARAGLPPLEPDASAPASAASGPHAASTPFPGAVPSGATLPGTAPAPAKGVTPAGRIVTFALLGMGMFNVLSSIPGFLDLASTMNQTLEMLGLKGEFSNFAAARTWGVIATIVLVAGYVGTAWLSFRRLKRNRSAWWIPLIGAVVTFVLVSICISVPMMGDPAFTQGLLTPPAG